MPTSAYASSVAEHFATGPKLHQAGRLAEAEAYYRRVLADQPKHADALNLLGAVAHQTGRHELAIELIGQAIQQNGENPDYFFNLAGVFYGFGKLDRAVAAYRQAINIKRDFVEALSNLGLALKEQRKLDEAVAAYRQAIHFQPNLVEAHYNLGVALYEQGRRDEAIAAYRHAISIKPNYAKAHYNVGLALHEQGSARRGDPSISPGNQHSNRTMPTLISSLASRFMNRAGATRRSLHGAQAIRLNPDLDEAYHNLGVSLSEKGRLDEAIAAWRQQSASSRIMPKLITVLASG